MMQRAATLKESGELESMGAAARKRVLAAGTVDTMAETLKAVVRNEATPI